MTSASEALERLKDGNRRFASSEAQLDMRLVHRRDALLEGQQPMAIILGCSDSRVPVELIFDQGPGELFVIRVAGNIVASSQIGSVEFAAAQFGISLVVVLGHTHCGAVETTLEELQRETQSQSKNLRSIVGRIGPAVQGLLATELKHEPGALMHEAVRSNVRASVNQLRHGSDILERLIETGALRIVGAEYSLETGLVDFFHCAVD